MVWLEKLTKSMMLLVGALGIAVIYGGFFYLLINDQSTAALPWYLLLSPWVCIYFGLTQDKQRDVIAWFKRKRVR